MWRDWRWKRRVTVITKLYALKHGQVCGFLKSNAQSFKNQDRNWSVLDEERAINQLLEEQLGKEIADASAAEKDSSAKIGL